MAFVHDQLPQAYERFVDTLLASQAYGEHWARQWLDLARYADSAGYADDPARTIWAYRDYVIKSFNANKPFDQFTLEQIAGDLLPEPSEEQLTATAFHRNTMTNSEGGTNDEEFRNAAVVDRVVGLGQRRELLLAQPHVERRERLAEGVVLDLEAALRVEGLAGAHERVAAAARRLLERVNGRRKRLGRLLVLGRGARR